jgi:predicted short-subunit dehydrogenase-like oxidoreductase (DUF2520 family)
MDSPIAIVGAGRVGSAFAIALRKRGAPVVALAGRDLARVENAATAIGGVQAVAIADLSGMAQRVLIAVSDNAIPEVAAQLRDAGFVRGAALHTSGCRGPEALSDLADAGVSTGTLHPLQTFPTAEIGAAQLAGSSFAIGGEGEALAWAQEIVELFDGKALPIRPEHWALYHAAAVIASNYHATILDAALECMEAAGVSRADGLHALTPLLEGTLRSILRLGPQDALTGPISRGDSESVRRNRQALGIVSESTRAAYDSLGLRTIEIMKGRGMPPSVIENLREAFLWRK